MIIEMDQDLANTILEIQHFLRKNTTKIGGLPCCAKWEKLVGIALSEVTNNRQLMHKINIAGCQSGRFKGTEYFVTCDVQGPISVRVMADSLEEVHEQIKKNGQQWIDTLRCDAKDAFLDDDDWDDFSPENIRETMEGLGYQCVYDTGLKGYWIVWTK